MQSTRRDKPFGVSLSPSRDWSYLEKAFAEIIERGREAVEVETVE